MAKIGKPLRKRNAILWKFTKFLKRQKVIFLNTNRIKMLKIVKIVLENPVNAYILLQMIENERIC